MNKSRAGFTFVFLDFNPPPEPSMPPPPATRAGTNTHRAAATGDLPRFGPGAPKTWRRSSIWAWLDLETKLRDHRKLALRIHHPSENEPAAANTGIRINR